MEQSRTYKVGLLASGSLFASLGGFIIVAVLSRLFSLEDYATYQQAILYFQIVVPFLGLGVPMALYYFLPNEKVRPRGVIVENVIFLSLSGLIFSAFLVFGGAKLIADWMKNPDLTFILLLLSPYFIFQVVSITLPGCLMSANRTKALAIFNASSRLFTCALVIIAALAWKTVESAIGATVIASGFFFCISLWLMFSSYKFGPFIPKLKGIVSQVRYGIPLGLAGIFGILTVYVDRLVVASKTSPRDFSVYVNGTIQVPFVSVVTMSITAVLLPELVRYYKAGELGEMLEVWQRAMVKASYLIFPITVFIFILAQDVIIVIFSEKYLNSVSIFRVFILLLPFRITSFGPIFHASNKNKYIVLINIATLFVHVPLLIFSISHFGIMGAIVVTVFSEIAIRISLHIIFIAKIVQVPLRAVIPFAKLWHPLIFSLSLGIPLLLSFMVSFPPLISIGVFGAYYFPVSYFVLTRWGGAPRNQKIEHYLEIISSRKTA